MNISEIKNPLFLKELNNKELKEVCASIRDEIIRYASKNGGYLSGNLSSIELSVMLNKVFDDEDILLFDGNDINYTHKILHGRMNELDVNSNGAYSLSNAAGLAVSRDLDHKKQNIVVVVNSTDLLSGRNTEALNLISTLGRKLIIVFNDDTTIDKGIGMIDKLISGLRSTKSYNSLKDNVKDLIRPSKKGDKIIENIHNIKTSIKKNVIDEGIFSEFNIDYIGPIDGHDLDYLQRAFEIAKEKSYPCVVHCLTTKGKGFRFAEASTNDSWNKVGPFDPTNGIAMHSEREDLLYARNIAGRFIEKMMGKNKDLVCVTTRNVNDYGVANVFAKYPLRCFDTVSTAENALGFASGLAIDGKIPYIALRSFELLNAFKTLKNQVNKLGRPFLIGLINDGNIDYSLLSELDHFYICDPDDGNDLQRTLYTAMSSDRPVMIILPDKCLEYKLIDDLQVKKLGIWNEISNNEAGDICVLASGNDLVLTKQLIISNGLTVDLVDCTALMPIDTEVLKDRLVSKKKIICVSRKLETPILRYANQISMADKIFFKETDELKDLFDGE